MSIRTIAAAFLCIASIWTSICSAPAIAGEVTHSELTALRRAVESGLSGRDVGSQTLGDLQRLLDRLEGGSRDRGDEAEPLDDEPESPRYDDSRSEITRLEREAADGKRTSLRTLSLYRLYRNDPEEALRLWNRMGETNPNDLAYRLMASYLELALGEYGKARTHLEQAGRLIGTRSGLGLSKPLFCDNIAGYRLYVPRQNKELLPGDNTLIYVEIEGADFHEIGGGESECRLMFGLRLKNEAGVTVWADPNYGEYAPAFNGPIRDLHSALSWRIPNDTMPGVYTLTIEAVEEKSKRRGDVGMEFSIGRRSTNSETRMDEGLRREVNRVMQDAGKQFPGASSHYFDERTNSFPGGSRQESRERDSFRDSDRYYELLRQNERLNRGTD